MKENKRQTEAVGPQSASGRGRRAEACRQTCSLDLRSGLHSKNISKVNPWSVCFRSGFVQQEQNNREKQNPA